MSDQNKFINTYIDNAVGLIHEQVTNIIHLKTQLKLSQDALAEKDGVIEALNSKIVELEENSKKKSINDLEYQKALTNAASWEQSYNTMVNKVSHMNTLMKQIADMKNQLKDKDFEIENLKNKKKKPPVKKQINKTDTPVLVTLIDDDKNDSKDDF
jgi:predicted RNase H-like nuclease (RuvC/YqgF family)